MLDFVTLCVSSVSPQLSLFKATHLRCYSLPHYSHPPLQPLPQSLPHQSLQAHVASHMKRYCQLVLLVGELHHLHPEGLAHYSLESGANLSNLNSPILAVQALDALKCNPCWACVTVFSSAAQ